MKSKTAIVSFIVGIFTIVSIPTMHMIGGFVIPDFPEETSLIAFLGIILSFVALIFIKKNNLEGKVYAIFGIILNVLAILIHFYFQSSKIGLSF